MKREQVGEEVAMRCDAMRCGVPCDAMWGGAMRCEARRCAVRCDVVCRAMRCGAMRCDAMRYDAVCRALLCAAFDALCRALLCSALLCLLYSNALFFSSALHSNPRSKLTNSPRAPERCVFCSQHFEEKKHLDGAGEMRWDSTLPFSSFPRQHNLTPLKQKGQPLGDLQAMVASARTKITTAEIMRKMPKVRTVQLPKWMEDPAMTGRVPFRMKRPVFRKKEERKKTGEVRDMTRVDLDEMRSTLFLSFFLCSALPCPSLPCSAHPAHQWSWSSTQTHAQQQ